MGKSTHRWPRGRPAQPWRRGPTRVRRPMPLLLGSASRMARQCGLRMRTVRLGRAPTCGAVHGAGLDAEPASAQHRTDRPCSGLLPARSCPDALHIAADAFLRRTAAAMAVAAAVAAVRYRCRTTDGPRAVFRVAVDADVPAPPSPDAHTARRPACRDTLRPAVTTSAANAGCGRGTTYSTASCWPRTQDPAQSGPGRWGSSARQPRRRRQAAAAVGGRRLGRCWDASAQVAKRLTVHSCSPGRRRRTRLARRSAMGCSKSGFSLASSSSSAASTAARVSLSSAGSCVGLSCCRCCCCAGTGVVAAIAASHECSGARRRSATCPCCRRSANGGPEARGR